MMQTLVWIPETLWGVPVFGFGWVLGLWLFAVLAVTAYQARDEGWSKELVAQLPVFALIAGAIIWLAPNLLEGPAGQRFLPIRGFGVMLLLAIVSGVGLSAYRAVQVGLDPEVIFELAFWTILSGVVGARAFYVIQYWPEFQAPTIGATIAKMLNAAKGGLVVYGSVIGGFGAAFFYLRRKGLPVWKTADIIAPGMILGQAIGRIGCFMNGCCYGGLCTLPLVATPFPEVSPVYQRQHELGQLYGMEVRGENRPGRSQPAAIVAKVLADGPAAQAGLKPGDEIRALNGREIESISEAREMLSAAGPEIQIVTADGRDVGWTIDRLPAWSLPVHPTQLYSFVDAALLALFLWAYYPYRRRDGEVFALLVTLHPISRFMLESIRTDEPSWLGTGLSISQCLSLVFLLLACGLWWYVENRGARATVEPAAA